MKSWNRMLSFSSELAREVSHKTWARAGVLLSSLPSGSMSLSTTTRLSSVPPFRGFLPPAGHPSWPQKPQSGSIIFVRTWSSLALLSFPFLFFIYYSFIHSFSISFIHSHFTALWCTMFAFDKIKEKERENKEKKRSKDCCTHRSFFVLRRHLSIWKAEWAERFSLDKLEC